MAAGAACPLLLAAPLAAGAVAAAADSRCRRAARRLQPLCCDNGTLHCCRLRLLRVAAAQVRVAQGAAATVALILL